MLDKKRTSREVKSHTCLVKGSSCPHFPFQPSSSQRTVPAWLLRKGSTLPATFCHFAHFQWINFVGSVTIFSTKYIQISSIWITETVALCYILLAALNFNFDNILEDRGDCLIVSNNPFNHLIASAGDGSLSSGLRALTLDDFQQIFHINFLMAQLIYICFYYPVVYIQVR